MARLEKNVRKRVILEFPPELCSATAKRTGKGCAHYRMVGSTICHSHGGMAKQVKAKAQERIALAIARLDIGAVEPREPGEVLTDALHVVDMVMRNAKLAANHEMTSAEYDKLVQATVRAHHMAKVNHDAGLDERRFRLQEAQAMQMQAVFVRVLNQLDLTPQQRALLPHLLEREIGAVINGNGASRIKAKIDSPRSIEAPHHAA